MKIQVDEVNGISLVDSFDENCIELTKESILLECLKDTDCLPLYADITPAMLREIKAYGYDVKDIRVSQKE